MCLPPISRGPPPVARGKSLPSSSSSSSGSSSDGPAPLSPRRHKRRGSNNASAESDLPSGRVATRQPSGLRSSAPPPLSRKDSTARKSSRSSSVAAGSAPSRKPSTNSKSARDATRLAPGSSPMGVSRSPAFSTKSEKPSRSPSKKKPQSQSQPQSQPQPQPQPQPPPTSESTSRRKNKNSETPTQQTPAATPRVPENKKKNKPSGEMDGRERIISLRAPLQGGGVVTGLMVVRPGSSRRGSESGSSRSKGSSRRSNFGDRKRERSGSASSSSGTSKATTLVAGPVGLGISLENSRTPTPSSKAGVERVREIEPQKPPIPEIAIAAPTPEKSISKPAPQAPPRFQVHPPPPPAPVPAPPPPPPPPAPVPELPVVSDVSLPKAVAPPAQIPTYPIMATLVYPTKDQLAYQPINIGHYRVTTNIVPTRTEPPAVPAPERAAFRPPPAPPSLQQYQDPPGSSPGSSPASSVHGLPLRGGGSPPISHRSSVASISTVSSSSSLASGSTISIVLEQEQPSPVAQYISYNPNATTSPNASTSSLVTVSSSASGSSNRSSNYFRMEPPRAPMPEADVSEVNVPELSSRKPNYYRYAAHQDTAPKPVRAIMDSPNPAAKRAGPWDGMPGADPNLGAYYRNAAAAKRREANTEPAPAAPIKPKNTGVDEANLAAYYHQAEVQRRKFALERMKHEQSEAEDGTSTSEVSSASEPWVDPNLAGYYRAAEAAKKKKEQEAVAKRAILRWNADKALVPSPIKEPSKSTTMVAGRNVFFSSIRRTIPGVFHSASHAPHVPFAPPPAPTPPPGEGAGLGGEDGPPEGAAGNWFKNAKMGADDSRPNVSDYWTNSSETTLPDAGAGVGEFPPKAPPPAPTPPLAREEAVPPSPGYYARSPRSGYGYHG